jgi:arginase
MLKLIGIPYDENSSFLKGPAMAPDAIRQMDVGGSANAFSEYGKEIAPGKTYTDLGDIFFADRQPGEAYKTIKETIRNELKDGSKIISLGGDHSVSFPIIEAFAEKYANLHVLHLDAHADLYNNFDDNPFSHASPFARILERRLISSLSQVGIRTLNTHQREQAALYNVQIIEMKDFHTDVIQKLQSPLYISLDIDVLDPAFAPGISHHEPGGLSTRELISVIQSIRADIVGADIVEYNPARDIGHMTAMVAYKLLKELASKML